MWTRHPRRVMRIADFVTPPSLTARVAAAERLAGLATPAGALGRLGELGVWVAATQGVVPPEPVERVRVVIFAGDHGVSDYGVSAYPKAITGAMVHTLLLGKSGVSVLAAQHGVSVRVLDIGIDDDLGGPPELTAYKVRRGSGAIHIEDALTAEETTRAIDAGAVVAAEEIAAGAQLLISGDMGIGNTTPESTKRLSPQRSRWSSKPSIAPATASTTRSTPSQPSEVLTSQHRPDSWLLPREPGFRCCSTGSSPSRPPSWPTGSRRALRHGLRPGTVRLSQRSHSHWRSSGSSRSLTSG